MIYLHYSENILDLKIEQKMIKRELRRKQLNNNLHHNFHMTLYKPFNLNYTNHIQLQQKK